MTKIKELNHENFSIEVKGETLLENQEVVRTLKSIYELIQTETVCIVTRVHYFESIDRYGKVFDRLITMHLDGDLCEIGSEVIKSISHKIKSLYIKTQLDLVCRTSEETKGLNGKVLSFNLNEVDYFKEIILINISFDIKDMYNLRKNNVELKVSYSIPPDRIEDKNHLKECNESLVKHLGKWGLKAEVVQEIEDNVQPTQNSILEVNELNCKKLKAKIKGITLKRNQVISKLKLLSDEMNKNLGYTVNNMYYRENISNKGKVIYNEILIELNENPLDMKVSYMKELEQILCKDDNEYITVTLENEEYDEYSDYIQNSLTLNKNNEKSDLMATNKGYISLEMNISDINNIKDDDNVDLDIYYYIPEYNGIDKKYVRECNRSLKEFLKKWKIDVILDEDNKLTMDEFSKDVINTIYSKEVGTYREKLRENSIIESSNYSIVYDGEFSIVNSIIGVKLVHDIKKENNSNTLPVQFRYEMIDLSLKKSINSYGMDVLKINYRDDNNKYNNYILNEILKYINTGKIKSYEIFINKGPIKTYEYNRLNNTVYYKNKDNKLVASVEGVTEASVINSCLTTPILINKLVESINKNCK